MSTLRKTVFGLIAWLLLTGVVFGQNFRGTFKMTSGSVTLTLVLDQDASGRISGTLSSTKGTQFHLQGAIEEGIATGTCAGDSGQSYFEAEFEGSKLIFTLTEVNASGEADSRSLEFVRVAWDTSPVPKSTPAKPPSPSSPAPPIAPAPQGADQGKSITDPGLGISFVPPGNWIAKKQGEVLLLGSNTHKGFILIQPHAYASLNQMSQEASQGIIDEESGILLTPASRFQAFGQNGLSGEFAGTVQGVQAKAFAIGLISPRGGGVTILAAVESGSYTSAYPDFVRSIASSLTFSGPQPSTSSVASGPSDASLMNYFKGEYYSYSGGSTISGGAGTERTITLCPDGGYRDSYEFSASGTDWGGAGSQRGAARWSIQGSTTQGVIVVTYASGQRKQIPYQVLSKNEGTILLDGIKFAFAGAPKCR